MFTIGMSLTDWMQVSVWVETRPGSVIVEEAPDGGSGSREQHDPLPGQGPSAVPEGKDARFTRERKGTFLESCSVSSGPVYVGTLGMYLSLTCRVAMQCTSSETSWTYSEPLTTALWGRLRHSRPPGHSRHPHWIRKSAGSPLSSRL